MKKLILVSVIFSLVSMAHAFCMPHVLNNRFDGGTIIGLDDGTKWQVLYGDEIVSNTWQFGDKIELCDDFKLVNDRTNEQVYVRFLSGR